MIEMQLDQKPGRGSNGDWIMAGGVLAVIGVDLILRWFNVSLFDWLSNTLGKEATIIILGGLLGILVAGWFKGTMRDIVRQELANMSIESWDSEDTEEPV